MRYDSHTFRGDVLGGITAAVIGLPSALAYGVARPTHPERSRNQISVSC